MVTFSNLLSQGGGSREGFVGSKAISTISISLLQHGCALQQTAIRSDLKIIIVKHNALFVQL